MQPIFHAYIIIGPNELLLQPITVYRGVDIVDHLIASIVKEKGILAKKLFTIKVIEMTVQDKDFWKATHCNLGKKNGW